MRETVAVPFVDTRAADLVWTLDHPPADALAARVLSHGATRLELRVLGASHQVLVETGGTRLVETVACLPGTPGRMPARQGRTVPGAASYTFRSRVRRLGPARFAGRVAALRRRLDAHPCSLFAVFPGHPLAVTALSAHVGGRILRWRTWHAYPQAGELVTTTTSVRLSPDTEQKTEDGDDRR
ncbi:DUF2617 family protein [Marinactinospora thermotolerans]|uniref:DUF2617 domain-containing protein n=1 Tax=Marinactinospora thermotolerans DSM 45154 TaxID=1122192 RepID=A0A1T4RLE1_9ACTN|nr:DUF2617 family protein [Marinactinospora thermotolerans]SKA16501.1 Protein of unknown function DUF2617 [Marinactinospora thermotolerans DSM 45154]